MRFSIPFIYPDEISADCYLLTKEKRESHISYQVDRSIEGSYVAFEYMIIKDRAEEIIDIGSLASTDNIAYANGLLGVSKKILACLLKTNEEIYSPLTNKKSDKKTKSRWNFLKTLSLL